MVAWRYEISLLKLKIFHSFALSTLEEKFRISARPCKILYKRAPITGKMKQATGRLIYHLQYV